MRIPPTVLALGVVSFFTDVSSEMIYPLLPVFLVGTLGAGAIALGTIEGFAEATAAFFKVFSGVWTDQSGRRKPLIVAGYSLAGLARPLIGLAGSWPVVLVLRVIDRTGKGIRTSPRDALIADVTAEKDRGRAYGFHRAMDHAGAVIGPLIAGVLLTWGFSLKSIFLIAIIPAILGLIILVMWVREPARQKHFETSSKSPSFNELLMHWKDMGPSFKYLLIALLIFTLGNSTDAFLLMRLSEAGVPVAWIAALWSLHHIAKMVSTYLGGISSDKIGPRLMIGLGWLFFAGIYAGFAFLSSPQLLVACFLLYGVYYGLVEPAERALVANLVSPKLRGTAFGYYHFIIGIAALPASLLFGSLWYYWGSFAAFGVGAMLAAVATCFLTLTSYGVRGER